MDRADGPAHVRTRLSRPGFYPAGGGSIEVSIDPAPQLTGLELRERGPIRGRHLVAMVANLAESIAVREVAAARAILGWEAACCTTRIVDAAGPGNVVMIELAAEHLTEIVTGFGERVAREARDYLDAGVTGLRPDRRSALRPPSSRSTPRTPPG